MGLSQSMMRQTAGTRNEGFSYPCRLRLNPRARIHQCFAFPHSPFTHLWNVLKIRYFIVWRLLMCFQYGEGLTIWKAIRRMASMCWLKVWRLVFREIEKSVIGAVYRFFAFIFSGQSVENLSVGNNMCPTRGHVCPTGLLHAVLWVKYEDWILIPLIMRYDV